MPDESRLRRAAMQLDLQTAVRAPITGRESIELEGVDIDELTHFARRAYNQSIAHRLNETNDLRHAAVFSGLDCFLFGFRLGRQFEIEEDDHDE